MPLGQREASGLAAAMVRSLQAADFEGHCAAWLSGGPVGAMPY